MRQRDHPRSRGVYAGAGCRGGSGAGSSPLARGLPDSVVEGGEGAGIIPARAGFTQDYLEVNNLNTDHPRSRGVYMLLCKPDEGVRGSSLLARGLLLVQGRAVPVSGIIPARAGVTS